MEVAEWQGRRYLRATSTSEIAIPVGGALPERFTMEFDYAGAHKYDLEIRFVENADPNTKILIGEWEVGVRGGGVESLVKPAADIGKRFARVRVMADGAYVKVYVDDKRVANVPNANLGRAGNVWLKIPVNPGLVDQALIGDVRVMAGGRKLYDAIDADGRVATQGILFATASDRLRPESTPTLTEIVKMMGEHGDLRLRIEGHTDSVGDDAANQSLSDRRAAAVKAYLIEHGVDAGRLESAGMGETKPVAGNDTPEGRQTNRRVELVKLQGA
jgi:outer membrane protein OmpA-like peptidoglycan-associated protein